MGTTQNVSKYENLTEQSSVATKTLMMDTKKVREDDPGYYTEYAKKCDIAIKDAAVIAMDSELNKNSNGILETPESLATTSASGRIRRRHAQVQHSAVELSATYRG